MVTLKIAPEIIQGIESRSKFLSNKFWHLEYEDLKQDGIVFILELLNTNPDAHLNWFMKAINNFYCNKMKKAIQYNKQRGILTPKLEENYPDINGIEPEENEAIVDLTEECEMSEEEFQNLLRCFA